MLLDGLKAKPDLKIDAVLDRALRHQPVDGDRVAQVLRPALAQRLDATRLQAALTTALPQ